jgi:hypothetical protein
MGADDPDPGSKSSLFAIPERSKRGHAAGGEIMFGYCRATVSYNSDATIVREEVQSAAP